MKLGTMTVVLGDKTFEEACRFLSSNGVQTVEIGCGGYPGNSHCDIDALLASDEKIKEYEAILSKYNLEISALSCHGNMVHPIKEKAQQFEVDFDKTVLLAEKLGVSTINTFSGCPGGSAQDLQPNWVTCPWPEEFGQVLEYQWNEVLIPFWKEKIEYVKSHGIHQIAIEMHPGFCVYNTSTLLRLRKEVGPEIGANFDPSHLIWQGMDPCASIRVLGKEKAIFHFHAKDTKMDKYNTAINGVLDTQHYGDESARSWIFRSVGYGNGEEFWKNIVSELRMAGYEGALSIEHEDSLMSREEGLLKAIGCLKNVLLFEDRGSLYWA